MNNDNKKNYAKIIKAFAWVTQLSLNMITPLILCLIAAAYIQKKFGIGNGIMLAAIIIGIGGGFMSLINFIRTIKKENNEEMSNNAK